MNCLKLTQVRLRTICASCMYGRVYIKLPRTNQRLIQTKLNVSKTVWPLSITLGLFRFLSVTFGNFRSLSTIYGHSQLFSVTSGRFRALPVLSVSFNHLLSVLIHFGHSRLLYVTIGYFQLLLVAFDLYWSLAPFNRLQ